MTRAFLDTNVLVYALGADRKAATARALVDADGGTEVRISAQILNEFANVARRKLGYDWDDVAILSRGLAARCSPVVPPTVELHATALGLAKRYTLAWYDALIVAAALAAGCDLLYSEDMHAGLVVEGRLTLVNPFA